MLHIEDTTVQSHNFISPCAICLGTLLQIAGNSQGQDGDGGGEMAMKSFFFSRS